MADLAYVNGKVLPVGEATISIEDRGFLFGDGVYEVIRCYGGVPFLMDEHLARLARSLAAIRLEVPFDVGDLSAIFGDLLTRSEEKEAVLYLQITRGTAPRNHLFPEVVRPTVIATVRPAEPPTADEREQGIRLITCDDDRWGRCDVKTTNLLANVLAKQAAHEQGGHEALLTDEAGFITEGGVSNFFAVIEGRIITHPKSVHILPGITRDFVIELAGGLDIAVEERKIGLDEAVRWDEAFVTGTTKEVLPVVKVDDRTIGDGRPGTVTGELVAAFRRAVDAAIEERA